MKKVKFSINVNAIDGSKMGQNLNLVMFINLVEADLLVKTENNL